MLLGRPPRSTAGQRAEVFRLADEGLGHRAVAAAVFGDGRYRLRVLRLLRRRAAYENADEFARRHRDELLRLLGEPPDEGEVARALAELLERDG